MATYADSPVTEFSSELAVVNGPDAAMNAYIARLQGSIPKVFNRLALLAGEEVEAELGAWKIRFDALDETDVRRVLGHPFFSYYWRQLMLACVRKDAGFVRAWSAYFGHFVAVPYLQGPGKGDEVELRLPEPANELRLPGQRSHLQFSSPVERVVIADSGDGAIREQRVHLPLAFVTGGTAETMGQSTRADHPLIKGTDIEIDGGHPWIARHLASMNSQEPQPGYQASDLRPRDVNEEDVAGIGEAFSLIESCWPELAAEIASYVRVFVPFGSDFHSSFTEGCLMGAIFKSEAATPYTSPEYTAEHILHEASHLRMMLLLEIDPLVTCRDEAVFNSPVRKDPRPLSGMLQAIFVFTRITSFNRRAFAMNGNPIHRAAQIENARLTAEGMDEIEAEPSVSFTPIGARLWQQMRDEINQAA